MEKYSPDKTLKVAHIIMLTCFLITSFCVVLVYGFDQSLEIPILLCLHISIIIFAAFFKLGYLLRLNSLKALGKPVN